MLDEDIIRAQKIVGLSYSNYKSNTLHHEDSAIYKQSNENQRMYLKYFKNKENLLSVIASSDQIINAILQGSKNIDAFDISRFAKYFMFLKLSGVSTLSKDEYIDFFFSAVTTDEKYDDMYDMMRLNLESNARKFWDSLFNFYDWCEIYNSSLFSNDAISNTYAINQNKYLEDRQYDKLKGLVNKVNIKTYDCNILDLGKNLENEYDLAYFSNIIYYVNLFKYKELLENIKLKTNGEILTYFYKEESHVLKYFPKQNYTFDNFKDSKSGVLVYKKIK